MHHPRAPSTTANGIPAAGAWSGHAVWNLGTHRVEPVSDTWALPVSPALPQGPKRAHPPTSESEDYSEHEQARATLQRTATATLADLRAKQNSASPTQLPVVEELQGRVQNLLTQMDGDQRSSGQRRKLLRTASAGSPFGASASACSAYVIPHVRCSHHRPCMETKRTTPPWWSRW